MRNFIIGLFLLTTLPLTAGVHKDLRDGGKLYEQKKYGQALAKYNDILKDNPASQEAAIGAGASAYYLKDYTTAQAAFKQAAEPDNPRQTDALFNLGNAYYRAKETDKAKQAYRQAILKNPQDKEAIHNFQLLLEENKNQQNQNDQNNKNQDKDSKNQNQQNSSDQSKGNEEMKEQQSQPSQAEKDAADRVMQMAKDQETKPRSQNGAGTTDNFIEKDW